jgi:hypothetical protein
LVQEAVDYLRTRVPDRKPPNHAGFWRETPFFPEYRLNEPLVPRFGSENFAPNGPVKIR